jgi:hypothetical protein
MSGSDRAFRPTGQGGQVLVDGRVLVGDEFDDYCEKYGMCRSCGKVKVREAKKGIFGGSWTDIPFACNHKGQIIVYKGYHISPTCYTLKQAKRELCEINDDSNYKKKKGIKIKEMKDPKHKSSPQIPFVFSDPEEVQKVTREIVLENSMDAQLIISEEATQSSGETQRTPESISGNEGGFDAPRFSDTSPLKTQHPVQSQRNAFASLPITLVGQSTLSEDMRHSQNHSRSASLDDTLARRDKSHRAFRSSPNLRHSDPGQINVLSPLPSFSEECSEDMALQVLEEEVKRRDESSEDTAIRVLKEEVKRRDVFQFLVQLDCDRAKVEVVRRGLQLLRELTFEMHRADPAKKYIFPADTWCKTIKSGMSDHLHDLSMQEEGAKTVAFMASFSRRYKIDLLRNHNVKEIILALDTHRQVDEICCMALESLTRTAGSNVPWRPEVIEHALKSLKSVLSDPGREGKEWAILALYNISCDKSLPEDYVFQQMHHILSCNGVIDSFSLVIQGDTAVESIVVVAVTILWRFSIPPENHNSDLSESIFISSSDILLTGIRGAMCTFGSEALHEATCGLLSSIDIPASTADNESISWKQTLSDAIWNSLTSHATVESVQLAGMRALCNLFCDHDESVADLDQMVEVIIFAMNSFPGNVELQAFACKSLACICAMGHEHKATVARSGGIAMIASAFRSHVVNVGHNAQRPPFCSILKDGASSTLASLTLSNTAIPLLQESNLLLDFQTIILRDGLPSEGSCVRTCVTNLIAASLLELDDASVGSGGSSHCENADSGYITLANLATLFLQGGNEEEVQSLTASLHLASCRASGVLDVILSAANGTGVSQLVSLMQAYATNASIQENGCGILGNIYYRVPFQGQLDQSSEVVVESKIFTVRTHTEQEVTVMRAALVKHKTKAGVVKNACLALCNFVSGLMVAASDPDDPHIYDEVALLYSGVSIETDHALAIHEDSLETQKSALRLVHAVVNFIAEEELQRCSGNLIAKIYEIMARFPTDHKIHECACSVLARFVASENDSIDMSLGNADGLRALLHSLNSDNEVVVEYATAIVSALLQRVFILTTTILEIDGYFDSLIDCLYRFPDAMAIQSETCLILATLATLNEAYVKMVIANHGGVTAALQVLQSHRGNAYVQECAIKALAGIAEGIPDAVLLPVQACLSEELLRALDFYQNEEGIQCATLEALSELCERDEYFTSEIPRFNGIPLAVAAMSQNLESEGIQKAGCKLFWMMAQQSDENKIQLAQHGSVRAVVLAMLSHITSSAIQKEALSALKHISRLSPNKEVLQRCDAVGAIRLAIWGNLEEPFVVCAALAAFNDIAVDSTSREVMTLGDDILSCVLRAMRTHPTNNEVQKVGCWLLRTYSYNAENLALMRAEQDELFELLPAASAAFPEDCSERAQYVLEKL